MANIVNTFTLKLQDQDFKSNLANLQKTQQQYQQQIAKGLVDSASKTQNLRKIEERALKAKSKLLSEGLSKSSKRIKAIDKTIASTKLLTQAEKKRTTGLKEAERALNKVYGQQIKTSKALKQNTVVKKANAQVTSNLANQTIRYLRWAGTIVGVLYAVNRAWRATLGIGLEVNKMMEDNISGIAALLSANTQMVLSNGKIVDSYEKFRIGQQVATKTMDDLRKASVKTYATFPQLTQLFQQSIGHTLGMGKAFGKTTDEIIKNTIKLTQRISNIAGSIGMPMEKAQEEIRSLLSGNVSTDSLIAVMLFGNPSEANRAMKEAKTRGENGVKDMLDGMLKSFDVLADVNSYTRSLLALEDSWKNAMQTMAKPLFEGLTEIFKDLSTDINYATESWKLFWNEIDTDVSKKRKEFSIIGDIKKESRQFQALTDRLIQAKKIGGSFWGGSVRSLTKDLEDQQKTINRLAKEYLSLQDIKKEDGDLLVKEQVDMAWLLKQQKKLSNEVAEKVKLQEVIKKNKEVILQIEKRMTTEGSKQQKASKIQIDDLVKASALALKEIIEIQEKAEAKALDSRQKLLKSEQTLLVATQKAMGTEVTKQEIITFRLNALGEELALAESTVDQNNLQAKIMQQVYNLNVANTSELKKQSDEWAKIEEDLLGFADMDIAKKPLFVDFGFRRLQAELIRDERSRAIELAKINLDSRRAELLVLKEKEGWTDEYYRKVLEDTEELSRRVMQGYTEYGQLMASVGKSMESSFESFFDFTSDGFMDMEDMALDVLDSIYKALLKNYIIGQATTATTSGTGIVGAITSFDYSSLFAKGDTFSGSPSLSAHSNTVVSQPTPFLFGKGGTPGTNLGFFAEAGTEAIMPLTRTASGDLGVKAVTSAPQKVTVNIVNQSGQELQATQAEASFDMEGTIISIVMDAVQTNKGGMRDAFVGVN